MLTARLKLSGYARPADALEWAPGPGRWSAGDQVRHLAVVERWRYAATGAAWKWLRAMLEHGAHHRGQLYLTLGLLGVPTPPIYGLTEPELRARSAPRDGETAE